jgi:hypothetical protein
VERKSGPRNVAPEVLEVVKKKDVDALFDAGGDLDKACEYVIWSIVL